MADLRELYDDMIKDHSKKPRNFRVQPEANHTAKGHNPLCGDRLTLYLKISDGKIEDISFQGAGCAISTASASMMTQMLKGKTEAEAEHLFERFHHMLTQADATAEDEAELGKLIVFAGVRKFPVRVKCATLAWHTFHAALAQPDQTVTTE